MLPSIFFSFQVHTASYCVNFPTWFWPTFYHCLVILHRQVTVIINYHYCFYHEKRLFLSDVISFFIVIHIICISLAEKIGPALLLARLAPSLNPDSPLTRSNTRTFHDPRFGSQMFSDLVLNRFYVIGGDSDGAICEGGCEAEARPGTTCHRQTCSRRCCQTLCASGCMIHFRRIALVWLCDRYSGKANKTARGEGKPGKSSLKKKKDGTAQ